MDAENPILSIMSSELNSTSMLLLELEMIFFCQRENSNSDFGPRSGFFSLAVTIKFPL